VKDLAKSCCQPDGGAAGKGEGSEQAADANAATGEALEQQRQQQQVHGVLFSSFRQSWIGQARMGRQFMVLHLSAALLQTRFSQSTENA
jgi:hypothetical protein